MKKTNINYTEETEGSLPFLLFWQSLDGRPKFEDIDSREKLQARLQYLWYIGRSPSAYHRIETINNGLKGK